MPSGTQTGPSPAEGRPDMPTANTQPARLKSARVLTRGAKLLQPLLITMKLSLRRGMASPQSCSTPTQLQGHHDEPMQLIRHVRRRPSARKRSMLFCCASGIVG